MSAGGLFGAVMNLTFFAAFWTVLGFAVDMIGLIFNQEIGILPTYQDAVNGFSIIQTIWGLLGIIFFIVTIINYIMNENALSSGEV